MSAKEKEDELDASVTPSEPGVYAVCAYVGNNMPIEPYLLEMPQRFPPYVRNQLNLLPGRQRLLRDSFDESVIHVIDWLPTDQYPRVVYWLEEVRACGIRRRLELSPEEIGLLGYRSRLVSLHSHGWIDNARSYLLARGPLKKHSQSGQEFNPDEQALWWCPKWNPEHNDPEVIHEKGLPIFCASLWWEDCGIDEGEPLAERMSPKMAVNQAVADRVIIRRDWGEFLVRRRSVGIKPVYGLAAVASWPISFLQLVPGTEQDHQYEIALRESGLYTPLM